MERKAFKLARRGGPDTSIISWLPLHNNNASHHYWFGAKGFHDWEAAAAARLVGWPQHPSIVSGWSINNIFPFSSIVRNSHYSKSQIHYTLSFHHHNAAAMTLLICIIASSKKVPKVQRGGSQARPLPPGSRGIVQLKKAIQKPAPRFYQLNAQVQYHTHHERKN